MCVQAIKRGHGCVSPSTKSPVDSYLCACVCNGSAPEGPIR